MNIPIVDTLRNLVTGLGTSKDKTVSQQFVLRMLTDAELNAMHRSDWLARKIVDIIPNDMTREWRDWQAESKQIEKLEELETSPLINLQPKLTLALQKARLFGGAAIYMGMRDGRPEEELRLDRVGQGELQYLHLLHRHEVTIGPIIRDVTSPYYGEPQYYEVTGANGTLVRVHPSRMVRFIGAPILDDRTNLAEGWGDSILQIVYDAVMNASSVQAHVAALLPEAKADVIYIPKLSEFLRNQATTKALTDRFTYANTIKSMFNMVLLEGDGQDQGERWEQKQINFSQMPEVIQQFLQIASGAADIPVTRLLGEAPHGLNASSEGEFRAYYDNIAARQKTELTPGLYRLDEVIIRSALGKRDPDIHYTWAPLWGLSEKEKAEIFDKKATAARKIAGSGQERPILPIEALSDALVNAFIEDGTLPGLEAAIAEYGKLSEQEEDEVDLQAAALPAKREEQRTADAVPRTLYVRRDVLNADEIIAWAKSQGFETTLPAEDMHVTIAYSRTPVDWMKVGEAWDAEMKIAASGPRLMERFGEATVLLFGARELQWRHEDIRRAGASWEHPEYQPHVTISYAAGELELGQVEPYQGEIVLGPEIFEELNEDWQRGIRES